MKVTFRVPYQISAGQKFEDKSQCVPGQAYNLKELVDRFTRGERLLVHQRPPIDMLPVDDDGNILDGSDETFENIIPQIEDPVDLDQYSSELKESHERVDKRIKSKKEQKQKEKEQKQKEKEQKQKEKEQKKEESEQKEDK